MTPRELGDPGLDFGAVDVTWIEGAAVPAHEFVMLLVVGLGHGLEEEFEARDSTDILRRAAPVAIDVSGIVRAGGGGEDGLDSDGVPPVVGIGGLATRRVSV